MRISDWSSDVCSSDLIGAVIFAGVLLLQFGHAHGALDRAGWIALAALLGAAFMFPLGNRLLLLHLERSGENLNATQRVFGMTLASQRSEEHTSELQSLMRTSDAVFCLKKKKSNI